MPIGNFRLTCILRYQPATSAGDAVKSADANLEYRTQTRDRESIFIQAFPFLWPQSLKRNSELIQSYLNGPRTLSNERISYLILSTSNAIPTPPISPNPSASSLDNDQPESDFDLLICAAHFIGDGMALHQFAHDFFTLLGGQSSAQELEDILHKEWTERWGHEATAPEILPCSIEESMPQYTGRLRRAVTAVDFQSSQNKLIGGQAFPKVSGEERRTTVPTVSFDEERTKAMLKACKAHGVSISVALFALCNVVWARMHPEGGELPM